MENDDERRPENPHDLAHILGPFRDFLTSRLSVGAAFIVTGVCLPLLVFHYLSVLPISMRSLFTILVLFLLGALNLIVNAVEPWWARRQERRRMKDYINRANRKERGLMERSRKNHNDPLKVTPTHHAAGAAERLCERGILFEYPNPILNSDDGARHYCMTDLAWDIHKKIYPHIHPKPRAHRKSTIVEIGVRIPGFSMTRRRKS